jgi:hypothetical protein
MVKKLTVIHIILAITAESLQGVAILEPCERSIYNQLDSVCVAKMQIVLKTERFPSSYIFVFPSVES